MRSLSNPYLATLLLSLSAHAAAADRLQDPTRPSNAKEVVRNAPQGVRLEAILHSEVRLIAIVNGKIVRSGDRVGDTRIDEINADSIRYTRAGRSEIARLAPKHITVRSNIAQSEE
jgi:hypothetical protein